MYKLRIINKFIKLSMYKCINEIELWSNIIINYKISTSELNFAEAVEKLEDMIKKRNWFGHTFRKSFTENFLKLLL